MVIGSRNFGIRVANHPPVVIEGGMSKHGNVQTSEKAYIKSLTSVFSGKFASSSASNYARVAERVYCPGRLCVTHWPAF